MLSGQEVIEVIDTAADGNNVQQAFFLTMLNMSMLAALASIMFVGRSTAAGPSDGTSWEMDAIASVFIGGAAVSGGIGLPWHGTQSWAEADAIFKAQLETAGFKPLVQHADNKVPQQQIESMIQNGAKVIDVDPVDGSQLGAVLEETAARPTPTPPTSSRAP